MGHEDHNPHGPLFYIADEDDVFIAELSLTELDQQSTFDEDMSDDVELSLEIELSLDMDPSAIDDDIELSLLDIELSGVEVDAIESDPTELDIIELSIGGQLEDDIAELSSIEEDEAS